MASASDEIPCSAQDERHASDAAAAPLHRLQEFTMSLASKYPRHARRAFINPEALHRIEQFESVVVGSHEVRYPSTTA
ncbi:MULTISPECIES: hypothetical protein [Burkholderia]|uniref:hypothetical protein n=1 Tax=Burkholderia TaxID=32008 RepID=UPI000AD84C75|nr:MULTISPECIES: hypothetical protein [Burkholderia]